jgi:hypothetical protein
VEQVVDLLEVDQAEAVVEQVIKILLLAYLEDILVVHHPLVDLQIIQIIPYALQLMALMEESILQQNQDLVFNLIRELLHIQLILLNNI